MRIAEIHTYSVDLPVRDGPYTMANQVVEAMQSTIVKIVSDTGLIGYGEACPCGPAYQPEHALGALAALAEIGPHLIGQNPLLIEQVHRVMDARLNGHNYAKAAVDIALWDILGKHYDVRLCDLLGGAARERVPSYYATGIGEPDEIARLAVEKKKQGYPRLQIKIGGRPVEQDIETVQKTWQSLGGDICLAADGNRSLTTRDTILFSNGCANIPLVIEQPCNSLEEIAAIRGRLNHPIYLDENTVDVNTVICAAGTGLCDGFSFKVTRLGGVSAMRTVRDLCKAKSLPHTCDDSWGGDIIAAACTHVGATVNPHLLDGVWVAEPYIDDHYDEDNGIRIDNGHINVPTGPGLGISPTPGVFGAAVASFG